MEHQSRNGLSGTTNASSNIARGRRLLGLPLPSQSICRPPCYPNGAEAAASVRVRQLVNDETVLQKLVQSKSLRI
jgi:hypothetical protein